MIRFYKEKTLLTIVSVTHLTKDLFYTSQHPDTTQMEEAAEAIKRFCAQMDITPRISLYDSDKGVVLEIPREIIIEAIIEFLD